MEKSNVEVQSQGASDSENLARRVYAKNTPKLQSEQVIPSRKDDL